jgi:hypothetical protein
MYVYVRVCVRSCACESNDILKGIEKASDPSLKKSTQLPWNRGLGKKFLGV